MTANRLVPSKASPDLYQAVLQVDALIQKSDLPPQLMELVKIRASQINGCAFCLDLHSQAARKADETQRRLDVLSGWREADIYSPAERAALAWTESLTNISQTGAKDQDYEPLKAHFSDKDIVDLTILIGLINLFNRLAVSMRYVVA
ncbi:carboxymuconolactone decarboxylase family protein [Rhizorhapis suberifaciens]|uniref:AhpD family alkylhydroperoxidase n=1 Tax=Rhizorhapis suberifaciens TaxID=13656 RepID=A0A840HT02_9SPHN|nr:carboxymuconolactone decarboxylase family protein [Rhizorhapis suberifaciens]MBB4640739.1 AhpD family alkylhydroperoxidase [Rhizorhapis suberifaciens]